MDVSRFELKDVLYLRNVKGSHIDEEAYEEYAVYDYCDGYLTELIVEDNNNEKAYILFIEMEGERFIDISNKSIFDEIKYNLDFDESVIIESYYDDVINKSKNSKYRAVIEMLIMLGDDYFRDIDNILSPYIGKTMGGVYESVKAELDDL